MKRNLPPLPAIRVFETAARHGSFTSAADELGMTQAAVSYQVKVLEERVGSPLFERYARGVGLTGIGRKLFHHSSAALDILSDAYSDAIGVQESTLTLSVIPTFATNFLAQRLGQFQLQYSDIAVRIEISEDLADFTSGDIDVAIRGGHGAWEGLASHLLLPTNFAPMLSPDLAMSLGGLDRPEDLLELPILSRNDPWWQEWLSVVGLASTATKSKGVRSFGSQIVEAGAAMAGHGVAMLTPAFFKTELANGSLVQPFEILADDDSGYWLVYPESRRNSLKIKRFRSWLTKETESFRKG
ncbi:MAG: LysR substrate-binding domain-containing protein [Pseudomonadota bacterium]